MAVRTVAIGGNSSNPGARRIWGEPRGLGRGIEDQSCIVRQQQADAITSRLLRQPIGNAAHLRDEVTRGLDLLFHGL
jgi:hypothetical protein